MRVALLPTGRTEWQGLPAALGRLFPTAEFYSLPTKAEVDSGVGQFPCPGFTSMCLTQAQIDKPPESARELIGRAARAALGDRDVEAADLVIILEDVELFNAHQHDVVVGVARAAAEHHVSEINNPGVRQRTATALCERVSFHLASPMIEAWFFVDAAAIARAGVPANIAPVFSAQDDPEDFTTTDVGYLAATEADCPVLSALLSASRQSRRQRKSRPKWLSPDMPREKHPKGYLL